MLSHALPDNKTCAIWLSEICTQARQFFDLLGEDESCWVSLDIFADAMSTHYSADFSRCAQRFAELIVRDQTSNAHEGIIRMEADYQFYIARIPMERIVEQYVDESEEFPKQNKSENVSALSRTTSKKS